MKYKVKGIAAFRREALDDAIVLNGNEVIELIALETNNKNEIFTIFKFGPNILTTTFMNQWHFDRELEILEHPNEIA